jgi:high-affinity iron transporter
MARCQTFTTCHFAMFQTLLITFREGLEAFLMVAVATLYLRKTGHQALLSAVSAGLFVSIGGSVILGVIMAKVGASSPVWEGVLALLAALAVVLCVTHMMKMGKQMSGEISAGLGRATLLDGTHAWWSVFVFTLFMVGREGVESAAMLSSIASKSGVNQLFVGGLIGLASAAAIALLWSKFGRQVNLSRFFNVTAAFMMIFSAMLVLKAFFEFTEVNLVPGIDNTYWHDATESLVEGSYAQIISLMLVLTPTLWLATTHWFDKRKNQASSGLVS